MEKDNWIDDVLNSTKGMHRAEPSPFIFEQITAKINKKAKPIYSSEANPMMRWALAIVVSVIISVNMLSLVKSNVKTTTAKVTGNVETTNELNNATIYTY